MKLGDAEFEAAVERWDTVERTFAVRHDGTREHLSDRVHPANPEPGVVYDAHGLPDSYATALQRGRWEQERKAEALEAQRGRRIAGGRRTGEARARDREVRRSAIAEIAARRGLDLAAFSALPRAEQRDAVAAIAVALAERCLCVAERTIRADIRAIGADQTAL